MLTPSENQDLTRVGPGTPMGNLLRQYWLPVLHSADLPEPDGAPRRVRLLGEDLVAFRNTSAQVGLVRQACPHRCASLFFGRNEEDGLRCLYHGWKFDIRGKCLETPNEPDGSRLSESVRLGAYPCVERQGILWTCMGLNAATAPPPEAADIPELGWAKAPTTRRGALKYQRACNWVQALEGDFDTSHLSFLHLSRDPGPPGPPGSPSPPGSPGIADPGSGIDYYRKIARMDRQPVLEVHETEVGVMYGAKRATEDTQRAYWRVTQFLMPFYTSVPGHSGHHRAKAWVPIDDEHTMVWEPNWTTTRDFSDAERKGWEGRIGPSGMLPDTDEALGRGRLAACAANDYLIDRAKQKSANFSGMEDVTPVQDAAMQESMGPISDRTQEHLGASDVAIIRMRQRLLRAARVLQEKGTPPPGARTPKAYHRHGDQMVLSAGESWVEAYQARMNAAYE